MRAGRFWKQVPLELIDQSVYGCTVDAYRHRNGMMLVNHRCLHKTSPMWKRIGMWILCDGLLVIARKSYYGRMQRVAPVRWANFRIKHYRRGSLPR